MVNPLDALLPQPTARGERHEWGTVTNLTPLQVTLDGETQGLYVTSNIAGNVRVGARVLLLISGWDRTIIGPQALGATSPWQRTVPDAPPWLPFPGGPGVSAYSPGGDWRPPSFLKTSAGIVVLSGLLGGTLNGLLGTLPVGYRPTARLMFDAGNGSSAGVRVDVLENGEVWWVAGSAAPVYLSLDGISFPAVGAVNWLPITNWGSGWAEFPEPGVWGVPSYGFDQCGRVWLRGLLRGSPIVTIAAAQSQTMFTLPSTCTPAQQLHLPAISASSSLYGLISAEADGTIRAKGGSSTSFISLSRAMWCPAVTFPQADPRRRYMKGRNNWVRYGTGHPAPQVITHADGLATCEGLISSGALQRRGFIFPPGYGADSSPYDSMQSGGMVFTTIANEARARADIKSGATTGVSSDSSGYEPMDGSTVWHSMNGINYVVGS